MLVNTYLLPLTAPLLRGITPAEAKDQNKKTEKEKKKKRKEKKRRTLRDGHRARSILVSGPRGQNHQNVNVLDCGAMPVSDRWRGFISHITKTQPAPTVKSKQHGAPAA
jgi:hypothetical protein